MNQWNVDRMRELVVNGAHKYPGANKVQKPTGELINLEESLPTHHRHACTRLPMHAVAPYVRSHIIRAQLRTSARTHMRT